MSRPDDAHWMRQAVLMAERGLGMTAPNPSVGAVLVRDGIVIARATTQPGGRPHAETVALTVAGESAQRATLYVTLEPCSHHGKTPPCAEAVISAGVARVVVGIEDPDLRVAGRGIAMLRAAGIEVEVGVEAKACRRLTLGHILRVTERRPLLLFKMALTADLTVPQSSGGRPRFVTGPEARAAGHLYRAQSDAILVGAGTVRDDDPELTCRLPGMAHRSPMRIVLDGKLDAVTPSSKLAQTARDVPVWVMTSAEAPAEARAALEAMGVRVSLLDCVDNRPSLDSAVKMMADDGITRLMVEGGRTIWQAFAGRRLLDEAIIFVNWNAGSAKHWGQDPFKPPITFERFSHFASAPTMNLVEHGAIGTDRFIHFERQ